MIKGNSRIGNGQLTSDSLIEDDYEAELGTAQVTYQESIMESNEVKKKEHVKIMKYTSSQGYGTKKENTKK